MKSKFKRIKAQSGVDFTNAINLDEGAMSNAMIDWSFGMQGASPVNKVLSKDNIPVTDVYDSQGNKIGVTDTSGRIIRTDESQPGSMRVKPSAYVDAFNATASAVTGVANFIQNNKLKDREQRQVLESLQPEYWQNMEQEGLNNIPMYTKYGGKGKKYQTGGSIVDYLNSLGNDSSFKARKQMFDGYFGGNYTGTAAQNSEMLRMLKSGKNPKVANSAKSSNAKKDVVPSSRFVPTNKTKKSELESGIIVDKGTNMAYIVKDGKRVKSFPVLTGKNPNLNANSYSAKELDNNPNLRNTPVGSYIMNPAANIYGSPGMLLDPIAAFGLAQPNASNLAVHTTYDPATREPFYNMPGKKRYQSYGCVNCRKPDIADIMTNFPQGDTLQVIDSRNVIRQTGGGCDDCEKKAGGNVTSRKAKKILKDGTVHGEPLTEKQKRYFGWIAGGKKQTGGGQPTVDLRSDWNNYVDWLATKGMRGNPALDKNETGFKYLEEYRKFNPNTSLTRDAIPEIQSYLQDYRNWVIEGHKNKTRPVQFVGDPGPNYEKFMPNLSKIDGIPGQYTTNVKFPMEYLNSRQTGFASIATKQTGGEVDEVYGLPDELAQFADVEAEAGEVMEMQDGGFVKVADDGNTHEDGGENIKGVKRVLEDTATKRKDPASKMLLVQPEVVEQVFGFKPKKATSHSKVFEMVKAELAKTNKMYQSANKSANMLSEMNKTTMNSLRLNDMFKNQLPTEDDVFELLFNHQEGIKAQNNINDDGSMAQYGGKIRKAQTGVDNTNVSKYKPIPLDHIRSSAIEAFKEIYKHDKNAETNAYDKGAQQFYPINVDMISEYFKGKKTNSQYDAILEQYKKKYYDSNVRIPKSQAGSNISEYKGGKTKQGSITPAGNPNAFNYPGGLDAFKKAWSGFLDLSQYKTVAEAQAATYDYLVKNQPDVAASIWQSQGITAKGKKLMQSDPNFAKVAKQVFNADGTLKEGVKLTPEQLAVLTPAYADDMLGVRAITPSQITSSQADVTPGSAVTPTQPVQRTLNTEVTVNPKFVKQPDNTFNEPTYWSDIAAPLAGLVDSFRRDPELYNPQQFHQLRYKLLDPTSALVANQADFNAIADEADPATKAGLMAQKYRANNQLLGQYEQQNAAIKNQEIGYNTQVRDKQSAADAQSRATFYRNVQLGREAQRQQFLTSLGQLSRVDQMKRRQNTSGNLIMKLSPAFDQFGEYNGYQYVPYLDPSMLQYDESTANATTPSQSKTKTTTTTLFKDAAGRIIKQVSE